MATLTSHTVLANLPDAEMISVAAKGFRSTEAAGLRAILAGAMYFRVRGDGKANANALTTAIATALAPSGAKVGDNHLSSAQNYTSKCRAAALAEHWQAIGNPALPADGVFDDLLDAILPPFKGYWQAVNRVKKSGPAAKAATAANAPAAKATAATAEPEAAEPAVTLENVPLTMLFNMVKARLSECKPDSTQHVLSGIELHDLRDAIDAELRARLADAVDATVPQAA